MQEPVFKGEISDIGSIDIEAPLKDAGGRVCEYFFTAYSKHANEELEAGNENKAQFYHLISVVTSFYLNEGDPTKPYVPMLQMQGKRSLIPDYLANSDYAAIRSVAERATIHAICARFYDVLWLKEKDHKDCRKAAEFYLESARELDNEDEWVYGVQQYRRGFQLAAKLGRKSSPFQNLSVSLCCAIEEKYLQEVGFRTRQLLAIASKNGCGDPVRNAEIASEIGLRASDAGDYGRARDYWILEEQFQRFAKDENAADSARLKVAESYVSEGLARAGGDSPSYMDAASFLKDGVEALRRARASRARVKEVKAKLAEYQELSLGEMKAYGYSYDVSDMAERSQDHVSGRNLLEALRRFALATQFVDLADLKKTVL